MWSNLEYLIWYKTGFLTNPFGCSSIAATDSKSYHSRCTLVAKMASHAIFQYNVLAIDDIHNTWTNMIIKMIILRLLGSSDDKEKIGVAKLFGPRDKI